MSGTYLWPSTPPRAQWPIFVAIIVLFYVTVLSVADHVYGSGIWPHVEQSACFSSDIIYKS